MTEQEWLAEASRRIGISEGIRLSLYLDSLGIPTTGVGFNLTRADAIRALEAVGVTDAAAVCAGSASITEQQALALLANDLATSVMAARTSLAQGTFDALTDARRLVITDLVYNMGMPTWISFTGTRATINLAERAKQRNDPLAHSLFVQAGGHLRASAYYTQTGDRAKRNVAMLVQGVWCEATGDGSDIYKEPND